MDRRKRKSRKAIFDACVELVQEKDFQSITIHEIVMRADLNRGTFYLHFADKYDMMNSFENEMIEKMEQLIVKHLPDQSSDRLFIQSRYDTILEILKCFKENKKLLQLLLKSSHNSSFQAKLRSKLKHVITEEFLPKIHKSEVKIPIDLMSMIFTSCVLSMAEYAYQSDSSINEEELSKFLIDIMVQGPAITLGFMQHEEAVDIKLAR